MKLDQYKEMYDCAPYTITEFAEGAIDVEDYNELKDRAEKFLKEQQLFEDVLSDLDIELG